MEAVQFSLKDKKLELVTIPVPKITDPYQVLIKVAYAGICGTDLHITEGKFPCNKERPFTLGHEFSGSVCEIGPKVKGLAVSDRVAVNPNIGCGRCKYCHAGCYNYCRTGAIYNGFGLAQDGGWARYALIPDHQVHKLPDGVTLEQAALSEPISCMSRGLDLISPIPIGRRILINGAGIIGNMYAAILHHQGHRKVTISEPNPKRFELIGRLGTGFDRVTPQILKQKHETDPNYAFDVVIDCSGASAAIEQGFDLLDSGGKLCLFGVAPPEAKISISPFEVVIKEARIVGVNINPFTFTRALDLIEAMGDRYLRFENLGIKTFRLEDYEVALEDLRQGNVTKPVFKID